MNTTAMMWNHLRAGFPWARARFENSRLAKVIRRVAGALTPEPMPVPVPMPVRRPRVSTQLVAVAALAFAMAAGSAQAQSYQGGGYRSRWYDDTADGRLIDVQVVVEGRTTPLYASPRGDDRMYFQALQGRNYGVVLHNRTGERVGVLLTVDGLNVIDGNRTSLSNREPMYVLDPWETATIRGWRTSRNDIRSFVFVDEERSYAERTGQGNGDLGWIRALAFKESRPFGWWPGRRKVSEPYRGEAVPREQGELRGDDNEGPQSDAPRSAVPEGAQDLQGRREAPAPSMVQRGDESNPGTGWGERGYDPVRQVDFRAAGSATDRITLRYEYLQGLRALGIQPVRSRDRTRDRDRGDYGYARPPGR